jgi:hypothetical protein
MINKQIRILQIEIYSHSQYRRERKLSDTENTNIGKVHISGLECPRVP